MASGDGPPQLFTNLSSLSVLVFDASIFPSLLLLFLISVSLPILPSFSSYFSLLPGAHRSVPDGNSETAGAPSEATWRRDRRGTIRPSPPLLSFTLPCACFSLCPSFFSSPLTLVFSLALYLLCIQPARLHRSSGWLALGSGPSAQSPLLFFFTHRFPPTPPLLLLSHLLSPPSSSSNLPGEKDGEAIQSRAVHQRGCLLAAWQADTSGAHIH